jgi:hypothetical protein
LVALALIVFDQTAVMGSNERKHPGTLWNDYVCIVGKASEKDKILVKKCPCNGTGTPYPVTEADLIPWPCPDGSGAKKPKG